MDRVSEVGACMLDLGRADRGAHARQLPPFGSDGGRGRRLRRIRSDVEVLGR